MSYIGPACSSQAENNKASLFACGILNGPHLLGACDMSCVYCGALHWAEEREIVNVNGGNKAFSTCCQKGKVKLPHDLGPAPKFPAMLESLLTGTSIGFTLSDQAMRIPGAPVFTIQGGLSHEIGPIQPKVPSHAHFSQIFVVGDGGLEEANHRKTCALGSKASTSTRDGIDVNTIMKLQNLMYCHNPYAKLYQMAGEVLKRGRHISMVLKTVENAQKDPRRYNAPTVQEVGIIIEGKGVPKAPRQRGGYLQRISDLHSSYFPLQYPIFFPYGGQQWEPTYSILAKDGKKRNVSQLELMDYLLFSREGQFSPILAGKTLFQELIVDMYACVESSRLNWFKHNQDALKVQMYAGLVEALGQNSEPTGQKIVLPSSFIGGPRAMNQLYQDAMALVAKLGPPDYFITITANPAWPEIAKMLKQGEEPANHATIIAQIFKMKLKHLMKLLWKEKRLGQIISYLSTIEFQKRGMPHMHLMITVNKHHKPNTPAKINSVVTAEIPDPVKEPNLYRIVGRSAWRLLQFEMSDRHPAVQRLALHEEDAQGILFRTAQEARDRIDSGQASQTMMTQFFKLNQDGVQGLMKNAREVFTTRSQTISVNGCVCQTFREAADMMGLLVNDKQYDSAMVEAAAFKTGYQLRLMFCIILVHSPPAGPLLLFNRHCHNLSNDLKYNLIWDYQVDNASEEQIKAFTLYHFEQMLTSIGVRPCFRGVDIIGTVDIADCWLLNVELLNPVQTFFYNCVTNSIEARNDQRMFYLDGPGGTGKTFVLNTLIDYFTVHDLSPVVVAATGVAALLLNGGQTAHSTFKIPLKFLDLPFGGKAVVFAGDFRQTLPVVKDGVFPKSELATLKSSHLWKDIATFSLKDNIRLGIGEGLLQSSDMAQVYLSGVKLGTFRALLACNRKGMEWCFAEIMSKRRSGIVTYADYMAERCILTPLNSDSKCINNQMLKTIPGEELDSISIDRPNDEAMDTTLQPEALAKINFPGFPESNLKLKPGIPVVLLRNLSIADGLCNGTRLILLRVNRNTIAGRILTGPHKGKEVSIPKITLLHEGDSYVKVSFYRYQFPVSLAFAMTINKCQGQSMRRVALVLRNQVFAHGKFCSDQLQPMGIIEMALIFPHTKDSVRILAEFVVMKNARINYLILGNDYMSLYGFDITNSKERFFTIGNENKRKKFNFKSHHLEEMSPSNEISAVKKSNPQLQQFIAEELCEANPLVPLKAMKFISS
ncbi:hypothetical protein PTTG_26862 [Puccinia triticina 1-1 BBBD Race 1]|uniref:ATP-dependent DNA helicase n=1 Tax=Puccinia triticina (isolate 1-1 / race 1 (BBBD)) TaxID=630390 RepID=A0A180GRI4_PUCT1|nr:hypothetical protein PTTG_26862 [Puccinia triticina 1-1 BBBD Race 1]